MGERKEVMKNLQREKDLVFWKSTYITWRNVAERAKDPRPIIRFRNTAKRVVQRIEARILVCLVLCLLIAGCQTFKGATGDTAWMLQKLSDNVQTEK